MPRNGSGTYSSPVNSWNPATNGVPATATDFQAQLNDIRDALTQSVSRDGQTVITGDLQMGGNKLTNLGAGALPGDSLRWDQLFSQGQQADIASAATVDIGAQNTTNLNITGTTTITSFGANYNGPRFVRFAGVLTLTHGAALVLPTGANITTAAGDTAVVVPNGAPATGWRVSAYQRASGESLVPTSVFPAAGITGTVAIANGGTGQATAAAAFTALKQPATDAATGVVELATTAEVQAATDTSRAVTPAGIGAVVIGVGQTWQDVLASRAANTNYTNSTGRPIQVNIVTTTTGTSNNVQAKVGAVIVAEFGISAANNPVSSSFIVPAGATYRMDVSGATITRWAELR